MQAGVKLIGFKERWFYRVFEYLIEFATPR